jgi:subtilisin family serine protease
MNLDRWTCSLGLGARVFMLDTGCKPSRWLAVADRRRYGTSDLDDTVGHGTRMASLIVSRDPEFPGLAPQAVFHVAQCVGQPHCDTLGAILDALKWALDARADVVSMSFAYMRRNDDIGELLAALDARGTICCAAYNPAWPWPHSYDSVVSAGRYGHPDDADVLTLGEALVSGSGARPERSAGSSVATAVLAGIAACAKAVDPEIDRPRFVYELQEMRALS